MMAAYLKTSKQQRSHSYSAVPIHGPVNKSTNVPAPIIIEQRENQLVHELGGLVPLGGASPKFEFALVVDVEFVGNPPDDIVWELVLDFVEPLVEGEEIWRNNEVSPRPIVIALLTLLEYYPRTNVMWNTCSRSWHRRSKP